LVSIRGVSIGQALFAGSSPIGYYIDSAPFGLVKSVIAPDEDVYDLQRIEVLRGPQGTFYGASALNGVVRVLTNDADLNGFDLKVAAQDSETDGGGNNYKGDLAVNVPLVEEKVAARAVLGYENDSGYIDTPVKSDVNTAELENFRSKVNAQPTDDFPIGLSYWGQRSDVGAPSTGDESYKNTSVFKQPISAGFDAYGLKLGDTTSGYTLSSATSYLTYVDAADFSFSSLVGFPLVFFTGVHSDVLSEELLLNSPNASNWRWSVGGMFRRGTEDKFQWIPQINDLVLSPTTGFSTAQEDTWRSFAGFGQITRALLDGRLEVTAGIREFEDHVTQEGELSPTGPEMASEGKFHATTPRAVVTWHGSPDLMLYGSFSEGFRSGFPQDVGVPPTDDPLGLDP
jgi:iron complex outermembrane recepter protein